MKKLMLLLLTGIFIAGLGIFPAAAEEELTLTATASSSYYSYYPYKAVDGNDLSFWVGGRDMAPWWITFDTGGVNWIENINIHWYGYAAYTATDFDIQVSSDNVAWEDIHTGLAAEQHPSGQEKSIERETRYIRLYIRSAGLYFPIIYELKAFTAVNIPRTIRFQGTLGDAEGVPLNGTYTLTFRLYDVEAGSTPLWEEVQTDITIENGKLDVELGSITPIELSFEAQYWLGVEVESDSEMVPRFKLTSVPYAFISKE